MNIAINRLDPNVPDPVESRRRAAGRAVRIAYSTMVFGVLAFFVIYFGRPLAYLSGPGVVSSPRYVVSFPFVVHVSRMNVQSGDTVKAGDEIGQVWSPQQDTLVATYMRALAEIAASSAELRIKVRVARDSLETARAYLRVTEEAVERVERMDSASTAFRLEVFRERASGRKSVVSLEAEVAETATQLAFLDEVEKQVREHLAEVERKFAGGRVFAPIGGIISTQAARAGQSLMAGTPVAEILDTREIFVDWYIPNERLADPKVGAEVLVLFGNWRLSGTIAEILPVSDVYAASQPSLTRERTASQIARIHLGPGARPPALNSTVQVHMHYTAFTAHVASLLVSVFGLRWL